MENVVELRRVNVAYLLKMLILMMIVASRIHRRCCSQEHHHHLVDKSSSREVERLMRTDEMACWPWFWIVLLFLKLGNESEWFYGVVFAMELMCVEF